MIYFNDLIVGLNDLQILYIVKVIAKIMFITGQQDKNTDA